MIKPETGRANRSDADSAAARNIGDSGMSIEREKIFTELWESDAAAEKIAAVMGLASPKRVYAIRKKLDLQDRSSIQLNGFWTDDRAEKLRDLWTDTNLSAPQIAAEIGCGTTGPAVIGKAHRLGLPSRVTPIKPAGSGPRGQRRIDNEKRITIDSIKVVDVRDTLAIVDPDAHAVACAAFGPSRSCAFPVVEWADRRELHERRRAGDIFCGAAVLAGSPYCDEHHARCYTPLPFGKGRYN